MDIKNQPLGALGMALLSILVGVIAGLGAVAFRGLIGLFHNLLAKGGLRKYLVSVLAALEALEPREGVPWAASHELALEVSLCGSSGHGNAGKTEEALDRLRAHSSGLSGCANKTEILRMGVVDEALHE